MEASTVAFPSDSNANLARLPTELLYQIFNHLLPAHKRDDIPGRPGSSLRIPRPPLLAIHRTCHRLRIATNSWATHFFRRQYRLVDGYEPCESAEPKQARPHLPELLRWMSQHCIFCGQETMRRAVLANGFKCCRNCDDLHWPDKITNADAKRLYHVADVHLQPDRYYRSIPICKFPLPKVQRGLDTDVNYKSSMFMRHEVIALAAAVRDGRAKLRMEIEARSSSAATNLRSNEAKRIEGLKVGEHSGSI